MFCDNCGDKIDNEDEYCIRCGSAIERNREVDEKGTGYPKNRLSVRNAVIVGGIIVVLLAVIFYSNSSDSVSENSSLTTPPPPSSGHIGQSVMSSVVNIACDNGEGGSGTLITEDGGILTNNHVIVGSKVCVVSLPDPLSGTVKEIYWAEPIAVPGLSKKYDIAMLEINEAYVDDEGYSWGKYPNTFPLFIKPSSCSDRPFQLGDSIRIFGYPVTSGGLSLTVTDGIISSFGDDGTILTSAKVDSGNSGGLAIDGEGCMAGIPSAVLEGEYQNLGVIIPPDKIIDFFDAVTEEEDSQEAKGARTESVEKIDCVGSDGMHLEITQKQCNDF